MRGSLNKKRTRKRGEKSPWVLAMQRNLDEYSKPHSWRWWKWTFIRNRAYRIWVEICRRGIQGTEQRLADTPTNPNVKTALTKQDKREADPPY